jgi:esterase/lipase superfamily enzyme
MVGKSSAKQAFVFIHGYNVAFDDAIYRVAQLAADLGFDGAPILYSWPSVARLSDYRIDEKNVEVTVEHLRWFLEDVRRKTGATVVHLIAHSMGNRALTRALAQIEPPTGSEARFSQVVLTAPDIDGGLFPALAASLRRIAGRVTIYASEHDLALEAARKYDTFQRVGSTKPTVLLFDGIDVVDASKVDTSLIGHSYFGDSTKVLSDLIYVIQGIAPNGRTFIEARGQPPQIYWAFR